MKTRHLIRAGLILFALLGCQLTTFNTLAPTIKRGELSVTLKEAGRTTQATLSEIDHLIVGVETIDAVATRSVSAIALTNGNASGSVSFVDLTPCTATISVQAFSATESIGQASTTAEIKPLQITHLSLSLTLNTTYVSTGNLALGISLKEEVSTPTPAPTPTPASTPTPVPQNVFYIDTVSGDLLNEVFEIEKTFNPLATSYKVVNQTKETISLCIIEITPDGTQYNNMFPLDPEKSVDFPSFWPMARAILMTENYASNNGWL